MQGKIYKDQIAPNLKAGQTLGFCHGFNIHFKYIVPPKDINVVMIAPKGPGHLVRSEYTKGGGVPCLVAVQQDATGTARQIALAWGHGIGGARAAFSNDLQRRDRDGPVRRAVRSVWRAFVPDQGGLRDARRRRLSAGDRLLRVRHEVKLIVDLIYQGGLSYMRYSISNTAEYGDLTRGPRIVNDQTRAEMKKILGEITSGQFAKEWVNEFQTGLKKFNELYEKDHDSQVEQVGRRLRKMMKWIDVKEV